MAGDGGADVKRWWADLPGDLLGTVYLRSATAYDQARFAAVCATWRAAALWHRRLPALPLLLATTGNSLRDREARAYSPEEGRALRIALPWFPWGNRLVGSYDGGWIATASSSDQLLLVNLFSGARAPLSEQQSAIVCACPLPIRRDTILTSSRRCGRALHVKKIICSTDPSSSSCILAAMTNQCSIALCRVGSNGRWRTRGCSRYIAYGHLVLEDIAFVNGELYGITHNELFWFDISFDKDGNPVATPLRLPVIEMDALHAHPGTRYIFQLRSNIAIAVEIWPLISLGSSAIFKVFELSDSGRRWEEVMSLDGYALFLGPACCKAMPMPVTNVRSGVEGNRIYYSKQHSSPHNNKDCLARLDLGSCTVYCCQSKVGRHLERITSRGYHYEEWDGCNGCNACMWLVPPQF
ncbi:uncharacterized protein [Aegilops tauschii subsp. strangulata]|uniref:uncharacterized protein n=1 Tax=Aegilops tauschii subsp. strangulata TaxID=200361 RepID=UPI000989AA95|nr:uncharacterized protein LOC109756546 [Aegilops tauschii subsp. strangulata]